MGEGSYIALRLSIAAYIISPTEVVHVPPYRERYACRRYNAMLYKASELKSNVYGFNFKIGKCVSVTNWDEIVHLLNFKKKNLKNKVGILKIYVYLSELDSNLTTALRCPLDHFIAIYS